MTKNNWQGEPLGNDAFLALDTNYVYMALDTNYFR